MKKKEPLSPPETDRSGQLPRVITEAVVEAIIPGGSGLTQLYRTTHPPAHELQREKWEGSITDEVNHIDDRVESLEKSNLIGTTAITGYVYGLVVEDLETSIESLRRGRLFPEFEGQKVAERLVAQLTQNGFSGGENDAVDKALSWCARILAITPSTLDAAKECLARITNNQLPEAIVAAAFVTASEGNTSEALQLLAKNDSSVFRSASVFIVVNESGFGAALEWMKKVGLEYTQLDADAKALVLSHAIVLGEWETAQSFLVSLTESDYLKAPVLYRLKGLTLLSGVVPSDMRVSILNQIPFQGIKSLLASGSDEMKIRRQARNDFMEAARIERIFECEETATFDDQFFLWLMLSDPTNAKEGREILAKKLRSPETALRYISLGIQYGMKVDFAAVEREIERQIALNGGGTRDTATARLALAYGQSSAMDIAGYIERNYSELSSIFDKKNLGILEIEALASAGLSDKAESRLSLLLKEGLSEKQEVDLRRIIGEINCTDLTRIRKDQFKKSNSLGDLVALIDELQAQSNWGELCEFCEILFQRRRSIHDAEQLAYALNNARQSGRIVEVFGERLDLRAQSTRLQITYCWALYNEGLIVKARTELETLTDEYNDRNIRDLHVSLSIALGDWHSLSKIVTTEYQAKETLNAKEIMQTAQLAYQINSPYAKELVFAAASKGNKDANVLASAYLLATALGLDNDETVVQWFQSAVQLSGKHGPIQQTTLKALIDEKPKWDRHEADVWQRLGRGEAPLFLAGQLLNKSLINMMLFPALANLAERDLRRKGSIAAFSGKRESLELDIAHARVGIDVTALLTLGFLNLLDKAFDAIDKLYVPHSTLLWLFEEKQKFTFQQPSRIKKARQVRDLVATDELRKFASTTVADVDLCAQVGDDLALLISEAEKVREGRTQHLVVHPSPVHRLGSLIEEVADLTEHADVLINCMSVIEKLKQRGQISIEEEDRARAYLQMQETPWPYQPKIEDGAVLYMNEITIFYFLHLGLLRKIKLAGLRVIVSTHVISNADALIRHETLSGDVDRTIERIRCALKERIETGEIEVGKLRKDDKFDGSSISNHPTLDALALTDICDAVIVDDRFINSNPVMREEKAEAIIFTTLDLLDAMTTAGTISFDKNIECRTLLRRAGYLFIPIREEELSHLLNASEVVKGRVNEIAELKAMRENLLQIRMSDWLQLPREGLWLDSVFNVFVAVLRGLWKPKVNLSEVIARSNWIMDQIDLRGWAHRFTREAGDRVVKTGRGEVILILLFPPIGVPQGIKTAYWDWVEVRVLRPIKEQFPDLYQWIVEQKEQQISSWINSGGSEGSKHER